MSYQEALNQIAQLILKYRFAEATTRLDKLLVHPDAFSKDVETYARLLRATVAGVMGDSATASEQLLRAMQITSQKNELPLNPFLGVLSDLSRISEEETRPGPILDHVSGQGFMAIQDSDNSTPPPPPPGQLNLLTHDDKDRAVLTLVGDYRFGSIFATLPEPDIALPSDCVQLDKQSFLRHLRGGVSYSIKEKARLIGAFSQLAQSQVDQLMTIMKEELRLFQALPPKELWGLQCLEWEHAEAWCRLEIGILERHSQEQSALWYHVLKDLIKKRIQAFIRYAKIAEDTSLVSPELRCDVLRLLSDDLRLHGRREDAETYLIQAIQVAENSNVTAPTRCAVYSLGTVFATRGNLSEAEKYLTQAVRICDNDELAPLTRCNALSSLGNFLVGQERFDEAAHYLLNALQIAEQSRLPPQTISNRYRSLGDLFRKQGNDDVAERYLTQAVQIAEQEGLSSLTRCNALQSLALLRVHKKSFADALTGFRNCRQLLFDYLFVHLGTDEFPTTLEAYGQIFEEGRRSCTLLPRGDPTAWSTLLWEIVLFWDAERCVTIREGLRRHLSIRQKSPDRSEVREKWKAGPNAWQELFDVASIDLRINDVLRATHPIADDLADNHGDNPIEHLNDLPDRDKAQFCQMITQEELSRLLTTSQTLLIGWYFEDSDLIALPIRKHPRTGALTIVLENNDLFRIANVRQPLRDLVAKQHQAITDLTTLRLVGQRPETLNESSPFQDELYAHLYEILQLDRLLRLFNKDGESSRDFHVIMIPDGDLFELPLHAAYDADRKQHLFEQVQSVSYALSLRTLALQKKIDEADSTPTSMLQGTIFAYPDPSEKYGKFLGFAREEVAGLVNAAGVDKLQIHGPKDPAQANRSTYRRCHNLGTLCWHIGHGGYVLDTDIPFRDGVNRMVKGYSFIVADGPVSDVRMCEESYDFRNVRHIHYSCCLLGRLQTHGRSHELEGMIASLALLGCRRVSSALWELCDAAAASFGRCLMTAIKEHAYVENPVPHAFSVAFKQAIRDFRELDNRRWNHEFYWAPYLLYGLP